MKSPQEPFRPQENVSVDTSDSSWGSFDRDLRATEAALQALKERYTQVQQDQQTKQQLRDRQVQLQQQTRHSPTTELKAELKRLQTQLDELEVNLESRLFSFGSLKESFWQVIRFGGLGIVIGWSFAFCTLQQPKPPTPQPGVNPNSPTLQR